MTRIIDRPEYKDWNIHQLWEELASMQSMLDREREAFEKEAGSFSRRYAQDRVTIAGWIKSYEEMFDKHTSIEKKLSYEYERAARLVERNEALVKERDELESTLASVYEQMEFYEWYWTANRDNHDREELNTDYHQVSGQDIPEEAWE